MQIAARDTHVGVPRGVSHLMLPAIRRTAQITFRKIRPELCDELIEEVVANCNVAYARLVATSQLLQPFNQC
jgi:hypothetical protein